MVKFGQKGAKGFRGIIGETKLARQWAVKIWKAKEGRAGDQGTGIWVGVLDHRNWPIGPNSTEISRFLTA